MYNGLRRYWIWLAILLACRPPFDVTIIVVVVAVAAVVTSINATEADWPRSTRTSSSDRRPSQALRSLTRQLNSPALKYTGLEARFLCG
jgi:hypothetical protein